MTGARLVRPRDVATVPGTDDDDGVSAVYVARIPGGPMVLLSGTAAVIWSEAVAPEAEETLEARVAARFDSHVDRRVMDRDVSSFVEGLVSQGLLERRSDG
jgi:Coenzyme PQQ synthesis protein D (PqqD)